MRYTLMVAMIVLVFAACSTTSPDSASLPDTDTSGAQASTNTDKDTGDSSCAPGDTVATKIVGVTEWARMREGPTVESQALAEVPLNTPVDAYLGSLEHDGQRHWWAPVDVPEVGCGWIAATFLEGEIAGRIAAQPLDRMVGQTFETPRSLAADADHAYEMQESRIDDGGLISGCDDEQGRTDEFGFRPINVARTLPSQVFVLAYLDCITGDVGHYSFVLYQWAGTGWEIATDFGPLDLGGDWSRIDEILEADVVSSPRYVVIDATSYIYQGGPSSIWADGIWRCESTDAAVSVFARCSSVVEPVEPDTEASSRPRPGPCIASEVPREDFYAVSGIPDDDPDGGLNLRDSYDQGAIVATLPEDTVVFTIEGCYVRDDGGVWWYVETVDSVGWVNSAWLSPDIPGTVTALGIEETEARVRTLLDALAAGDWGAAANALNDTTNAQLDDGGDLATQLEVYCARVICDAPYEIVATEGIYPAAPSGWASPSVDVRFFYPGGAAIEVFHGHLIEGEVRSLDALPGRSTLAYRGQPSTVAELVVGGSSELEDAGLYSAVEKIRRSLLAEHGAPQLAAFLPEEGMVVSSDAYIPALDDRVQITAAELLDGSDLFIWGYTDGLGEPIVDTVEGWMATYTRDLALLHPDVVAIDERIGYSTTVANLPELFPNAHIVEFHRQGRGEFPWGNWSSIRLAVEERAGEWKLMAITSDTWTI